MFGRNAIRVCLSIALYWAQNLLIQDFACMGWCEGRREREAQQCTRSLEEILIVLPEHMRSQRNFFNRNGAPSLLFLSLSTSFHVFISCSGCVYWEGRIFSASCLVPSRCTSVENGQQLGVRRMQAADTIKVKYGCLGGVVLGIQNMKDFKSPKSTLVDTFISICIGSRKNQHTPQMG